MNSGYHGPWFQGLSPRRCCCSPMERRRRHDPGRADAGVHRDQPGRRELEPGRRRRGGRRRAIRAGAVDAFGLGGATDSHRRSARRRRAPRGSWAASARSRSRPTTSLSRASTSRAGRRAALPPGPRRHDARQRRARLPEATGILGADGTRARSCSSTSRSTTRGAGDVGPSDLHGDRRGRAPGQSCSGCSTATSTTPTAATTSSRAPSATRSTTTGSRAPSTTSSSSSAPNRTKRAGWTVDLVREDSDVVGNVLRKTAHVVRDAHRRRRHRRVEGALPVRQQHHHHDDRPSAVWRLFDGLESVEMHNNVIVVNGTGGPAIVRAASGDFMWVNGTNIAGSNNWIASGATAVPSQWTGTITRYVARPRQPHRGRSPGRRVARSSTPAPRTSRVRPASSSRTRCGRPRFTRRCRRSRPWARPRHDPRSAPIDIGAFELLGTGGGARWC